MKFTSLLFSLLILFSCSNDNQNENEKISATETVKTEKAHPIDTIKEINLAVQENPLTIEDFPKTWFLLDELEDSYIINEYCEASTQQLVINKEGNDWFINVFFGQDGEKYKIIEFDAYEETRENFEIIYGSFILENPSYPDMDVEMYDFMWNKDLMFCNFEGFFQDKAMMVSEQNKDNYETVTENCDYLQENEER